MKNSKRAILLSCCMILFFAFLRSEANAQLVDNDSTAAYLAVQCAISSGTSSDNYAAYAASLAKTMGQISAADQEEIFGYVPTPSGSAGEEAEEALSAFQSILDGEEEEDDEEESGSSGNSWWEMLLAWWKSRHGG